MLDWIYLISDIASGTLMIQVNKDVRQIRLFSRTG